ncbi:hypothetical protein AOE01nite_13760 [Acetobacter oeni]|uniref:Uncharacterized protein n=1 Tax=Acetobacter oeni TaxID=304077 RepID=A0A511XJN4_9PROT|nr:hypothetical protein AOE01nite_13760 [Acetobacter oeni]
MQTRGSAKERVITQIAHNILQIAQGQFAMIEHGVDSPCHRKHIVTGIFRKTRNCVSSLREACLWNTCHG